MSTGILPDTLKSINRSGGANSVMINSDLISADRPIHSCSQDRLGRAPLAIYLADTICSWTKGKDSIVIALYGDWGSGKTSLKEMLLEILKGRNQAPAVLEFNPWNWTAQEKVSQAFYREINVSLGKEDIRDKAGKAATKWRKYQQLLEIGAIFIEATEWVVGANLRDSLFSVLLLLGAVIGASSHSTIMWSIAGVLFGIGTLVRFGTKLTTQMSNKFVAMAERTLPEVRKDLEASLRELQKSLLIVIDDIDRLPAVEIREVVQLVKANANLPNLIYLLLFDRNIVEHALNEQTSGHGREFLEKIVQIHFDLPSIEYARLQQILYSQIEALLAHLNIQLDQTRWLGLTKLRMINQFASLRDVYRFLSTLTFHITLFKKHSLFEVNAIDLIGLEMLRTFAPETYRFVRENKAVFTSWHQRDDDLQRLLNQLSIINPTTDKSPAIYSLLTYLFPSLDPSHLAHNHLATCAAALQVCVPDYFERYFLFRSPDDDISEIKFAQIISTTDKAQLQQHFSDLAAVNLLDLLIERLILRADELDKNNIAVIIAAVFDAESYLRQDIATGRQRSMTLIQTLLGQIDSEETRRNIMAQAFELSKTGIFISMNILHDDNGLQHFFSQQHLLYLKSLWVHKVAQAAYGRTLPQTNESKYLFRQWRASNPIMFDRWLTSRNREEFYNFLDAYVIRKSTPNSGANISEFYLDTDELTRVMSVYELQGKIEVEYYPALTEREMQLLELIRQAWPERLRIIYS